MTAFLGGPTRPPPKNDGLRMTAFWGADAPAAEKPRTQDDSLFGGRRARAARPQLQLLTAGLRKLRFGPEISRGQNGNNFKFDQVIPAANPGVQ